MWYEYKIDDTVISAPSKQWCGASVSKTAHAVCIEDGGVMAWGVRRRSNKTCGVGRRWWPTTPRTYFGHFSRRRGHDWRGPAICHTRGVQYCAIVTAWIPWESVGFWGRGAGGKGGVTQRRRGFRWGIFPDLVPPPVHAKSPAGETHFFSYNVHTIVAFGGGSDGR